MKHYKILLITAAFFLFASCQNESSSSEDELEEGTYEFPEDSYYFNVPRDAEKIIFPEEHEGKNCYVIYTNDTKANLKKEDDKIKFDISERKSPERSAVNESGMTVYKTPFTAKGKYQREEVRFNTDKNRILQNISGRSGARTLNAASRTYRDLSNRNFFVAEHGDYIDNTAVTFELKKTGAKCRIWYKVKDGITIDNQVFDQLAAAIDSVFTKETQVFGSNAFHDNSAVFITANSDTKLEVLVYDLFGDYNADQDSGTFGFFNDGDFWLQEVNPNSNEAEVIHLDSHFLTEAPEAVMSTAVHEFQHLLNFCNKTQSYDVWYTEMLSMCAEDVFQKTLNIEELDSPKNRFVLSFSSPWKGFLTWPEASDSNVYYAYANAYAFGAFLMRNYGGVRLIHEIATNKYVNEESITKALQTLGYYTDFSSVLRTFGMVYIFTEQKNYYSLCKEISQTYSGTNYTLEKIFLSDYLFKLYESKAEYENDIRNYYDAQNIHGRYNNTNTYLYFGPVIFKNSYNFTQNIQPYGFTVFYAGNVDCEKEYSVKHDTKLTMTLVVKE